MKKIARPERKTNIPFNKKIWTGLSSFVDKTWRYRFMFVYYSFSFFLWRIREQKF